MLCPACHTEVPDGQDTCPQCGEPLSVACAESEQAMVEDPPKCDGALVTDGAAEIEGVAEDIKTGSSDDERAEGEPVVDDGNRAHEATPVRSPLGIDRHEAARRVQQEAERAQKQAPRDPLGTAAKTGKGVALAAGILLLALLACYGGWRFLDARGAEADARLERRQEEFRVPVPVTVRIEASGWDTAQGDARLPVRVTGTDAAGDTVDEVQYVDSDGTGLALRRGSYHLEAAGPLIAANGTLYSPRVRSIEVRVGSEHAEDGFDATGNGSFELAAADPLAVTDEQIGQAYDLAAGDASPDAPDAAALRDAALALREEARAKKVEEGEAQERRRVTAQGYELALPAYWDARVEVSVAGNVVTVNSSAHPRMEVCRITVQRGVQQHADDAGRNPLANIELAQGHYATLWARPWSRVISDAEIRASQDPDDYYTMDEATDVVDLQTGGATSYAEVLAAARRGEAARLFSISDEYLANTVGASIKPAP